MSSSNEKSKEKDAKSVRAGLAAGTAATAASAAATETRRIAAYERLLEMPEVFSLNTMVRATGMNRETAKVTLIRWTERGMVESAGPRAGIYFNRVLDRQGERANAVRALIMKYPSATLCGASVLHAAGWTTQIPSRLHVAVESRPSYAKLDGVELHPRPIAWFQAMQARNGWVTPAGKAGAKRDELTTFGIRALAPVWALADLYADDSASAWHPDEDDLDVPESHVERLMAACQAMGAVPEWVAELQDEGGGQGEALAVRPRERG